MKRFNEILLIFTIFLIPFISTYNKFQEKKNNIISLAEPSTITTITKDDESALTEAIKILNQNGGIIYINTPVINISTKQALELSGSAEGGIVGLKLSNDEYPIIDFKNARNNKSTQVGFKVSGTNKFIKYLIIQNAANKGINIVGKKNTIDHVISRYNSNTGIQISKGAEYNTINYSYSYRNCDVKNYGGDADGFAPKLDAKYTVFNYCFAWDNSDDGWDSFDKEGDNSIEVTYLHCACWNNGNVDVFTGKYDYDNGKELDKNMLSVQQLIESDSNFENNYKNKKFSLDNGKINGMKASEWIEQSNKSMNGNGYKLGSAYTEKSTNVKRTADYCVAFDHKGRGFDNNNSEKCTGAFTNCVAFNNRVNYGLPYTFEKWANNWSWGATKGDQENFDKPLLKPSNTENAQRDFYKVRDNIINAVYANKFPDDINFDKVIKGLS